jgi:hypothetical protein
MSSVSASIAFLASFEAINPGAGLAALCFWLNLNLSQSAWCFAKPAPLFVDTWQLHGRRDAIVRDHLTFSLRRSFCTSERALGVALPLGPANFNLFALGSPPAVLQLPLDSTNTGGANVFEEDSPALPAALRRNEPSYFRHKSAISVDSAARVTTGTVHAGMFAFAHAFRCIPSDQLLVLTTGPILS